MKTALRQLSDEIDKMIENTEPYCTERFYLEVLRRTVMKPYFEIEKQQIVDAANQIDIIGKDHLLPGEEYYNKTYNNEYL